MTRILVTNDDGVFSEGIKLLAAALEPLAEVTVVAPDREQSAMGHALTLQRPLRMRQLEERVYSVDGTPTDCVSLAVSWLMKDTPPDLVVSGINFGLNLGDDVTYSGTVSATFEGTLMGIPSVAFSQEVAKSFSFERAADFAAPVGRSPTAQRAARGSVAEREPASRRVPRRSSDQARPPALPTGSRGEARPPWSRVLLDRRHAGLEQSRRAPIRTPWRMATSRSPPSTSI